MKILLVDNNTVHKKALAIALRGHEVEVQKYHPGLNFNDRGKDLIILSGGGGEGQEIADKHTTDKLWYEDEMEFVLSTHKPIVGICMGFEVIASAYGAKVAQMDKVYEGTKKISLVPRGVSALARQKIFQHNAHQWNVPSVPQKHFSVLAESATGIEIIRHKTRPIIATQFHPEKPGSIRLDKLITTLNLHSIESTRQTTLI